MTRRTKIIYVSIVAILIAAIFIIGRENTRPLLTVYKNTYSSPQEFEEGIFAAKDVVPVTHRIRAVIVPHHLVASASIAQGIAQLKGQSFKKIVMLSPDHFFQCEKSLCTANTKYQTYFGDVSANRKTVEKLIASPIVSENPNLFKTEHGIFADVPFVAKFFPGVPVTPIALNTKTWKLHAEEIRQTIESVLDDQTILIVSSDFSHYLPLSKANEMDEQIMETMFAKDFDGISKLNNADRSDCPGCLWTLAKIADDKGFYNPSVLAHTNSASILKDEKIPETTSHFAVAWYANDALNEQDAAFAGDVTVTRGNARKLSDEVKTWWQGDGIRVANLEGPLSVQCVPDERWYIFCNPLERFDQIKNLATHFGIMNNHMMDQGDYGDRQNETERLLMLNGKVPIESDFIETDSVRLVAVTEIMNPVPDAASVYISQTEKLVLQNLRDHPSSKLTVVYVHGGDEYAAIASDAWTKRWEQFIDAGADAVVVVHSHVPGDVFFYKNKPIFRGLGNFVFDQYDAVSKQTVKLVRLRKENGIVQFETHVAK